ncbi:MAG: hypothetical protein FJ206_09245 [Gemmatimonadetes bacterium]|nr:hypothetical protein [Gemmatimonadota bacterium]
MIELRTLGAVELRSAERGELRAILQQPKRLALLVYLASSKPGKLARRDSLLALFWPELDQEHARAALRRALYFLRQAGGPELIVGRGDEEVGVASDRLWSDAVAFDQAVDRNDLAAALDLYRGDFLDGFYVQGAPEAEAWLDRERTRRRYDAAQAAWQLARAALPDLAHAGRFAQRAIDLAPHDQDALLAFLGLLSRLGERSLGERLVRQAAERLRTDLGIEPRPELLAAADRIRPPEASDSLAPHQSAIAVLPFSVRGDPAFRYLADGLVELVCTKLDGSGALRTIEPKLVVDLTPRNAAGGTDADAAQAIASKVGAGWYLVGTVLESGGRLEIGVALYRADGRLRARAEGRADSEAGLFELVDDLVRQLLANFDHSAAGRLGRLAALTTESLPALKAYLRGEHEFRLGRHLQAVDAFRRASIEDASFGLAHYRMASSLAAIALIGPARTASTESFRLRERLSDHDRLLLEAQHYWLHGHADEAERRYAALTVSYSEQVEPWYLLGDLLFHSNPYRGRSIAEARGPFERAVAIEEAHQGALTQLARLAAMEGRLADLDRYVAAAHRHSPSADQAIGLTVLRAFAAGDRTEQAALASALAGAPGLAIARAFADVALYANDPDGAYRLGVAILPSARSPEFIALGHLMLAHLDLAAGRVDDALGRLDLARRHEPAWALEVEGLFAALPVGGLPGAHAARVEARLEAWDPSETRPGVAVPLAFHDGLHGHLRLFLLGNLAVRRGALGRAAELAEHLAELPVPTGHEAIVEHLVRTIDALVHRANGRSAEALGVLERLRTGVWFQYAVGSPLFAGVLERFLRAELLEELGRGTEARQWYLTIAQRSPYELILAAPAQARASRLAAEGSKT